MAVSTDATESDDFRGVIRWSMAVLRAAEMDRGDMGEISSLTDGLWWRQAALQLATKSLALAAEEMQAADLRVQAAKLREEIREVRRLLDNEYQGRHEQKEA